MSDEQVEVVNNTSGKMTALRGKYGKDANCGDGVAEALKGADLNALLDFAENHGIDVAKYAHLNNGQKRMNVGNRIRAIVKKGDLTLEQLQDIARAEVPVKAAKAEPASTEQ